MKVEKIIYQNNYLSKQEFQEVTNSFLTFYIYFRDDFKDCLEIFTIEEMCNNFNSLYIQFWVSKVICNYL